MYISHIALENFAGIYSGTGKKSISIDFPNPEEMNSKIVLLLGGNGSGKSTLMSVLHPFAESFDARDDLIMKSESEGSKEIHFSDKKGLRYIIKHYYNRTKKGGIKTKSFIQKFDKKKATELNENGGVTTFKEIVENEFRLNSDYFKIGRLASQTANFTALQTAQRKDFIIQYLPNSEPYLEAYRNAKDKLNKIKDTIDYIAESLKRLGNKETIQNEVKESDKRFKVISKKIIATESSLKSKEEKIKELQETEEYKAAIELRKTKEALEKALNDISLVYSKKALDFKFDPDKLFNDKEITEVMTTYGKNTSKRDNSEKEVAQLEEELKKIYDEISKISTKLEKKKHELKEYKNVDKSLEELQEIKNEKEKEINELKQYNKEYMAKNLIISFNQYENSEMIKYSSFMTIKNFFVDLSRYLQSYYSEASSKTITPNDESDNLIQDEKSNFDLSISLNYSKLKKVEAQFEEARHTLRQNEFKFNEAVTNLKGRPETCTDDNCFFIKQYVKNSKLDKEISKLKEELETLKQDQETLSTEKTQLEYCKEVAKSFKIIEKKMNDYKGDMDILMTIFSCIFDNPETVMDAIKNSKNSEGIIRNINKIDIIFSYLKNKEDLIRNKNDLENIKTQIESVTNNEKFIKSISSEINNLENDLNGKEEERSNLRQKLDETKRNYEKVKYIVSTLEIYIENRNEVEKIRQKEIEINKKIEKASDIYKQIDNAEKEIEEVKKNYDEEKKMYDELEKALLDAKTKLNKYEEFEKNYAEATENSKKTEVVVNSCDPKKGIPLAFMQEFLNSTSEFANELFDMAYQGKFRINFEVNEKEFNIPVLKEDGTILNDIKEASDGESSLVKTIISLALLSRYNSVFPIICLDEVDGCLDDKYRGSFAEIIEGQIEVLGLEQVFVISHNENFRNEDIPVILFPRNTFGKGEKNHVIWEYDK